MRKKKYSCSGFNSTRKCLICEKKLKFKIEKILNGVHFSDCTDGVSILGKTFCNDCKKLVLKDIYFIEDNVKHEFDMDK